MNVISIAASGMQAAQNMLNVAANNIANAGTPGYQSQRVDLADISTGGVAVQGVSQTGQPVNLATEAVDIKQAQLLYGANAMVVKAADQMYGSLLDMFDTDDQNNHHPTNNS